MRPYIINDLSEETTARRYSELSCWSRAGGDDLVTGIKSPALSRLSQFIFHHGFFNKRCHSGIQTLESVEIIKIIQFTFNRLVLGLHMKRAHSNMK